MERKDKSQIDYKELQEFVFNNGADLFGVAEIANIKKDFILDKEIISNLDRAVSIGVRLSEKIFEDIIERPTKLYFHHYKTCNMVLDQIAFKLAGLIQRKGFLALAIPASQIVDWQKQTSYLSHKKIGSLAGLGWIGRNNLLVNEKFGSQFRLVTVLTAMPLRTSKPINQNCGSCKACIEVCPVKAIKLKPDDFDHIACYQKLKDFQRQKFVDQYICGICLRACNGRKN